ncbi:beta-lactamase family protein [Flavobacterium sp. MFBS3-15]|uniref:serine hydrolase domain-containing protein n=1 Tax=Flavobacterium sp. MFBS3-15 TaxID=2989816 RepID=UPI002235EB40|nr:serine hydrolase domain-containing protein [Flavobacterium sp. MFBS3-15]MCW4468664.1 beta-lactamase family protein [Flavobacterium sp. MFBS3-15]
MKRLFLSLFVLAITIPALAQSEAKYRKIDSLMNHFSRNNKFMGVLSIREKGRPVFEKAYGFADVEAKVKATPDTKYKIGSVTKMFTSAMIFQLVDEKKLKLDMKLSDFFPRVKNAEKIKISDLLGHTSGVFNITDDANFDDIKGKLQSRKQILDRIESYNPVFEPGVKAEYSNTNYLLLGYIIQDITNKTYKEAVFERIVKRAGLKNTYYFSKINPKKKEAYSYKFADGKWVKQEEYHESSAGGAGGLQSTAPDLTLFARALFDGTLISKESLAEMTKMEMGFGRGLFAFPFGERKFLGHNGDIEGFATILGYYPKEDVAISLTLNGVNTELDDMMIGILSCYYKLPYRFPNFATTTVDDSILQSYEGLYSAPSLPYKVKIVARDGKLVAIAMEPGQGMFELNPLSETEFNYDPANLHMIFSPKGFTLKQGGQVTEFKKDSP